MKYLKLIYGFLVVTFACFIIRPLEATWEGVRYFCIGFRNSWDSSTHPPSKYYEALVKTYKES